MRELFVERRTVRGEDGVSHCFDYYVVIGEMEVKVAEQGGDSAVIPNVTVSISRIDGLMELLTRNTVGPAAVGDVVADWL